MTQAAAAVPTRPALVPYALASASLCALALFAAGQASQTRAALFGAGAATLSAVFALPALALGTSKGTSGILAGFVAGFFVRMVAVAAGLILSRDQGDGAVAYAAAFFLLYALTQAVEVAYVWSSSRKPRAGA